jgi:hypothetical protein
MRVRLKQVASFLANNAGIARASIINDLKSGSVDDNSSQVLQSISKQLREVYGDTKDELELKVMAQQQLAAVENIFLRASVFKEQTGVDFYDDRQRAQLMDKIIDSLIKE